MNIVVIENRVYDVLVTAVEESFNILYGEETGRTIASGGRMFLSPIGTFIGHKVTFARKSGHEAEYDELYDFFLQPRFDGIYVSIVHDQTTLDYEAYVSNGARALKRVVNGKVLWGEFQVNFIPMEAKIKP
jgi:hypothetical protein